MFLKFRKMSLFGIRSAFRLCLGALLLPALMVNPVQARNVRNILVLHSYHQGLQWTDSITKGIQSELKAMGDEIEIHYEYLDTKRNAGELFYQRLVEFEIYKTQLANIDFKLIISSDNNALRFILDHGDKLFPGVPVVFCGVNDFHQSMLKGRQNITGVVEDIDYRATLDIMRRLHPLRNKILVVVDRTPTGKAIKKEVDKAITYLGPEYTVEYYQDFVLTEVGSRIAELGSKDLIYMLAFNRDRDGNFISYVDGIRMVRRSAKAPIYGSWDFYFGNGIIGGMITSGFAQGQQAARLAKQILEGTPVDQIPILTKSPNRYMFDHNEMRRFGINPAQLPENTIIINCPSSVYKRFKAVIIPTLVCITLMALILGWRLVVQRRTALALKHLNVELDRRVDEQTLKLQTQNDRLQTEVKERQRAEAALKDKANHLEEALSKVKTLSGMLPICANCKKIRDDKGYWNQLEQYIDDHSEATFSHGICPECSRKLYPEIYTDTS